MVCVIFVLSLLLCAVLSQQIHLLSEEQQELFEKVHIMPVGWGWGGSPVRVMCWVITAFHTRGYCQDNTPVSLGRWNSSHKKNTDEQMSNGAQCGCPSSAVTPPRRGTITALLLFMLPKSQMLIRIFHPAKYRHAP